MNKTRSLLAVFARLDDESYRAGGRLDTFARHGMEVVLVLRQSASNAGGDKDLKVLPAFR